MNFGQTVKHLGRIGNILTTNKNYLVFGSGGTIGSRVAEQLQELGNVLYGSRDASKFDLELE